METRAGEGRETGTRAGGFQRAGTTCGEADERRRGGVRIFAVFDDDGGSGGCEEGLGRGLQGLGASSGGSGSGRESGRDGESSVFSFFLLLDPFFICNVSDLKDDSTHFVTNEQYLVACLETSSLGRATSLFTTIQSNPSMLPLLSPQTWSTYYSLLLKGKDLSSLVEAVVFQVASKEENTSPLAAEVLAKVVELAREVGGERGAEAEEKLKKAVGEERFEEAVKSSGGKGGE